MVLAACRSADIDLASAKNLRVFEQLSSGRWEFSIDVPERYVVTSGNQLRSNERGDPAIELRSTLPSDHCAGTQAEAGGICDGSVSRFLDVGGEAITCRVVFVSSPSAREREAASTICNSVIVVGQVDPEPPPSPNTPDLLRPGETLRLLKRHGQSNVRFTIDAPRGYRQADTSRIETLGAEPLLLRDHGDPVFSFHWAWPEMASCFGSKPSVDESDAKGRVIVCPGPEIEVRRAVRSGALELVCTLEQDAVLAKEVREEQIRDAIAVCNTLKFLDDGPP
jgi:hypothetical protein